MKDLLAVFGVVVLLGVLWVATGGPARSPYATAGPFIDPPYVSTISGDQYLRPRNNSNKNLNGAVTDYINIDLGNIARENRAREEYLTISLDDNAPGAINLTGWRLTSGRSRQSAAITFSNNKPIILSPGGRAIIITGDPPPRAESWVNGSFHPNICSGYLEDLPKVDFTPRLDTNCPDPAAEPGLLSLDDRCYDFVRSWGQCETPEFESIDGVRYLNGRQHNLDSRCRDYLEEHFGYNQCLRWHGAEAEFYGDEWRVYLGLNRELWLSNRETFYLSDQTGRILKQISY